MTVPGFDELGTEQSRSTDVNIFNGEFDSGSERTLAAWIRHASRAERIG